MERATIDEFARWWAMWGEDNPPRWPEAPGEGVGALVPAPIAPPPLRAFADA